MLRCTAGFFFIGWRLDQWIDATELHFFLFFLLSPKFSFPDIKPGSLEESFSTIKIWSMNESDHVLNNSGILIALFIILT